MALEPVPPSSVVAIIAEALGAEPGPRLLAGAARAEGNPFLVLEIVQGHAARGMRRSADGTLDAIDDDVPASAREVVLRRIEALPPEVVEVLRIATVLGRSFDAHALQQVAQLTGPTLMRVITRAIEAGVLVERGPRLAFGHDLVREAVYDSIPLSLRSSLHLAAARALASDGADAFAVASQYAQVEPAGAEAVDWLVRAAEHTRLAAPATAAVFFERALVELGPDDPRRDALRDRLLDALVFSGRLAEVEALAERWLGTIDEPDRRASVQYSIGQALFLQGRLVEAAARFEAAGAGSPTQGRVLADTAFTLLLSGELDRARATADRAIVASARHDDPVGHTAALCAQSWIVSFLGDYDTGHRLARQAVDEAEASGTDEPHRNLPYLFFAQVLLWLERDHEAADALDRSTQIGHRLGLVWDAPLRQLLRARLRFRSGSWDDAVADAEAGLSYARDLGGSLADVWLECLLARIAVQRRDLAEVERRLQQAFRGVDAGAQGADQAFWIQGLALEAAGELGDARTVLSAVWAELDRRDLPYFLIDLAPDLVRVARRCEDDQLVASVLDRVDQLVSGSTDPRFAATAARCRGIAADDPGALADAEARFAAISGDRRPIDLAMVRMEQAAALDGAGRTGDAQGLAAAARSVLDPVGIQPLLVRDVARAEPVAGPGVVAARASSDARHTDPGAPDWDQLTRSERRVVALVGRGLSNTEIAEQLTCSRRTVESHLHHVYTKVGIESRVQLAVQAARLADLAFRS
jgi:DNA-binding CsgD family transcriptional regulator/tetratricopeptide (TPR) repeat protein